MFQYLLQRKPAALFLLPISFATYIYSSAIQQLYYDLGKVEASKDADAQYQKVYAEPYDWVGKNYMVADGFGSIEKHTETNSVEAFEYNYSQGFRIFKTELSLTTDSKVAAIPNWSKDTLSKLGQKAVQGKVSSEQFKKMKIQNKYASVGTTEISHLLKRYSDAYLMLNVEGNDESVKLGVIRKFVNETKAIEPNLLERVIVEVDSAEMAKKLKEIYPFKHLVLIVDEHIQAERIAKEALSEDIKVVVLNEYNFTSRTAYKLSTFGIDTYVEGINNEEKAKQFMNKGANGVFTQVMTPEAFK